MRKTVILICLLAGFVSCRNAHSVKDIDWENATVEKRLEIMRGDTEWISHLDSVAGANLGHGAKCIDPVKHTFSLEGRTWIYNQDWGGALEIPSDYLVEDDLWQAELSFHGTRVFSPDSSVVISFYAGYQPFESNEDKEQIVKARFEDEPYVKITGMNETEVQFEEGSVSKVMVTGTITDDGIEGIFVDIFRSPGNIEYCISIQYPVAKSDSLGCVIEMVRRYPFGPSGLLPREEYM